MIRGALLACGVAIAAAGTVPTADAQSLPRWEAGGGPAWITTSSIVDGWNPGWTASLGWQASDWMALELQFAHVDRVDRVTFLEIDAGFLTALVGPRFTWRRYPVEPFGRILIGRSWLDIAVRSDVPFPSTGATDEADNALQLGGGVDIPIARHLRTRLAYDYRRVFAVEPFDQHGGSLSAVVSF